MTSVSTTAEPTHPARPAARPEKRTGLLASGWGKSAGLVLAGGGLVAACVLSLVVGSYPVAWSDMVSALTTPVDSNAERIVRFVRIPRTLTGLLAGLGLGIAGVVMQGLTRNPLAGPGILGINAGAAFAVVAAMAVFQVTALGGYLWFACAGAAVSAVFVYVLGSLGTGGASPVKLALAGTAFTAMVSSVTTAVTLLHPDALNEFRFWAVGSLTRSSTGHLLVLAPVLLVGLGLAVAVSRTLNMLALGEDMARSLGTRLGTTRALGAVSVVLLAGAATAIAGPIGFVGLVVPHIARTVTGPDYRWIMPWSLLLSPAVLLLADVLGRVLLQPGRLQVGIVTGIAGAPFFLYLVRNRKVAQL